MPTSHTRYILASSGWQDSMGKATLLFSKWGCISDLASQCRLLLPVTEGVRRGHYRAGGFIWSGRLALLLLPLQH